MNRIRLLIVFAIFLTLNAYGQGRTAKEQTILNVFGRLNLTVNPYDNINSWTDGFVFFRPYFFDPYNADSQPRAIGDTILFYGGTTHEGGYSLHILLASDGSMTVAADDYRFKKGDRVTLRVIGNETLLLFSDVRTGGVKDVLKKFDGNLSARYVDDIFRYILSGKFMRRDGSGSVISFDHSKSTVTGLTGPRETTFTLFEEFGHTPISALVFDNGMIYMVARLLDGIELTPAKTLADDEYLLERDDAKPALSLVKTAEGEQGMPPGHFPLVSKQVMTLNELQQYAGKTHANVMASGLPNLQIMRNEIFARHGYRFRAGGDIAGYFAGQSWYRPQYDDVTSRLTEIERINIALIQILESR